ncbi:Integrase catalytic domain-containing protein, partial [Aphis craccivora]
APVDLLLGGDVYATIMDGRKVVVDEGLPAAFSSIFGWILMGSVSDCESGPYRSLPVSLTVSLEGSMHRFWNIEEPEAAPETFTDDGRCETIFRDKCVRLASGRFSVPLPFRTPVTDSTFIRSRDMAVKRFESLERKLASDPKLKLLYTQFMSEYLELGHMSIAQTLGRYYIPHHAICKTDEGETKIRVVFDASAKCPSGMSLNNALCPGPKLQRDIVDILVRFRLFRHAFTADIRKMYRQILILPEFRTYQHILWRASPHEQLVDYELNTVTYGVNCAPFLALRVLQEIAAGDGVPFPSVRDALNHHTYVDDICYGANTVEDVVAVQHDLNTVLARSGLELRKWASNTPAILQTVPADHRAVKSSSFANDDSVGTKVLGLHWHPNDDYFSCELSLDSTITYTKRGILSLTARFFDPLGLFAPTIFLAKHIMQRTWQATCTWDGPLPKNIQTDWAQFVSELPLISSVRVPRFCNTAPGSACLLLGFCDASLRGYAAVVYLRILDAPRESSVFLIGTKTKLAPLKALTVPRLELNAALLLARWMNRIRLVLGDRVTIVDTFAWTDSLVVLSWLTVPHETFRQYVSNRVHQIQSILPVCSWQHVSTHANPADCASRGLMPSQLSGHTLYWHGPDFIRDDPTTWQKELSIIPVIELPEIRPTCLITQDHNVEWYSGFSSHNRLVRVTARLYRFIRRCHKAHKRSYPPYLQSVELDEANHSLVLASQRCHFSDLIHELSTGKRVSSKSLNKLHPFLDATGAIRVGGRLRNSALSYDAKHPLLLAKNSHLAQIICQKWHLGTFHAGPRVVTALISRQYWIISIRSVLFKISRACATCVRFDGQAPQPLMADLPPERVLRSRPFSCVGVDYAGPLQMREMSLRKSRSYKVYIAIFVCFAVKAVHLEVVTELSTDAFLSAFDRFVARRGVPSDVFSDCGTNFIGADKQLQKLVNSPEGQITIAEARSTCRWHFNPPSAPHFGGLWEAAVRSTKRLLTRTMGHHVFTYEEFVTLITRIEAVLNSRPLTPVTTDPSDLDYLSPGHFLIGQPLLAIPPRVEFDSNISIKSRWKLLDQCHQSFWRKWSTEYLTTLNARTKWASEVPNIQVNDMVIIIDNQNPPLLWKMGR